MARSRLAAGAAVLVTALLVAAPPATGEWGYLTSIGTPGSGPGQFFEPYGIDGNAAGELYVAETGNFRIQKLKPDGTPFDPPVMWGTRGTLDGQFDWPYDIALDGAGNVYVADSVRGAATGNARVQKFDANGGYLAQWGSSGGADGQFAGLSGIAAHTDTSGPSPQTFVYTSEPSRVQKFEANGVHVKSWGTSGFGPGEFRDLWDVATDTAGNVYTLESYGGGPGGNARIQKFDKDGTFLAQWSVQPQAGGQECYRRLAVDTAGFSYATAECVGGSGPLKRFNPAGELVGSIRCGNGGGFVGADRSGKVYLGPHNSNLGLIVFGEGGGPCPEPPPPPPPPPPPDGGGGAPGLTFGGAEGVTINDGARFTNDADVVLTIVPAGGATEARISNDGGFRAPTGPGACATAELGTCVAPIVPAGTYAWRLDRDPGRDERLPKTVYVRFANANATSALTFSDDIILDTTAPTIPSASVSEAGAGASTAVSAAARRYTVRLRARDNASGVDRMQIAVKRSKPGKLIRYAGRHTLRASRPPVYVRVRDRAGNVSKWRRLQRRSRR